MVALWHFAFTGIVFQFFWCWFYFWQSDGSFGSKSPLCLWNSVLWCCCLDQWVIALYRLSVQTLLWLFLDCCCSGICYSGTVVSCLLLLTGFWFFLFGVLAGIWIFLFWVTHWYLPAFAGTGALWLLGCPLELLMWPLRSWGVLCDLRFLHLLWYHVDFWEFEKVKLMNRKLCYSVFTVLKLHVVQWSLLWSIAPFVPLMVA